MEISSKQVEEKGHEAGTWFQMIGEQMGDMLKRALFEA